jgi:hypothetical protein
VVKPVLSSLLLTTVQEGAKNQLWAATADRASIENGAFYTPVGVKDANELWE